ncbi:hypothetical protein [Rhizobium oryzihabitans]|uniref:hypothetical protein n=1 Tax=Rhizobium oryzihabitans TaxID=2267833 RepID=UPI004036D894
MMPCSGKQLLLITNSDYQYTDRMMTYAYTRYLPQASHAPGLNNPSSGTVIDITITAPHLLMCSTNCWRCGNALLMHPAFAVNAVGV